eukprot:11192328-Lingulodinium_polyedra.AAC.1
MFPAGGEGVGVLWAGARRGPCDPPPARVGGRRFARASARVRGRPEFVYTARRGEGARRRGRA